MKRVVFLIICMVLLLVGAGCRKMDSMEEPFENLVLDEPDVESEDNPLHDEGHYYPYFYHVNGEIRSQDAYFITVLGDYTVYDLIGICEVIAKDCDKMHEVLFFEPNVPRMSYGDDPYGSISLPERSYCIARFKVIYDKEIKIEKVDGYEDRD